MANTRLAAPDMGFDRWMNSKSKIPSSRFNGKFVKRTREETREYNLRKYGLTNDTYLELVNIQNGVCKICRQYVYKKLEIDHDHKTGKFRGLLCGYCNKGLGHFKDNPTSLIRAIQYLKGNL